MGFSILLLILSFLIIFVLPYGVRYFFIYGLLLSISGLFYLLREEKEVIALTLNQRKSEIFIFTISIGCLLKGGIYSAIGSTSLFFFLSLFHKQKIKIPKKIALISLFVIAFFLSLQMYAYLYDKELLFLNSNSNYLSLVVFYFFLLSVKLNFFVGRFISIVIMLLLTVRNLQLAILAYYVFSRIKNRAILSYKFLCISFFSFNLLYFSLGLSLQEVTVPYFERRKETGEIYLIKKTFNKVSSGRIKLNSEFLKSEFRNIEELLMGKGKQYTGRLYGDEVVPVHNSLLILIGRYGLIYTVLFMILLFLFFKKNFKGNELLIIVYLFFGSFLHGLFETVPLLAFCSLLVTEREDFKCKII